MEWALEGPCQGDLTATIQLSEILRNMLPRMIAATDRSNMLSDSGTSRFGCRPAMPVYRLIVTSADADMRSAGAPRQAPEGQHQENARAAQAMFRSCVKVIAEGRQRDLPLSCPRERSTTSRFDRNAHCMTSISWS